MEDFVEKARRYLFATPGRQPLMLVRGQGCRVWDSTGREYLDFVSGLATTNLGHAHPAVTAAIQEQAAKMLHTSCLYQIEPQIELARLLVENSFADKVFFCNSGAEANETALKLARKYAKERGQGGFEVISCLGSFHGRTLATLSATGQEKFHAGFHPLVPGFRQVPFNDLPAMARAISPQTSAVLVEPIQAEGGVNLPGPDYLPGLRRLCDERGVLLILDEVQTGMGRTGELFAYPGFGVEPHVMTLAKALGNGVPIGACLAVDAAAAVMTPSTHASTFGGNHLATRAGVAVIQTLLSSDALANCRRVGAYLRERLQELARRFALIKEIRGKGLLLGMELDREGLKVVDFCREHGVLINCTTGKVLRFLPPLIVTEKEVDQLLPVLEQGLRSL
ncbi:MAG: acetylornithine aminotransferase [Deltaproteobacteria bacterium RBG_13_61_14]|nr:MAG: acetylornithine aminotransferase [Deltaproteobacteria bacterium RBG_13_61_14]